MPHRHVPQQRRSQERVERILDAAASLLEERGVAALSTRSVAARAGVSVGSLYRFFADIDDVLRAVALRHVTRLDETLTAAAGDPPQPTWSAALGAVVEAYVGYCATEPGFRALWLGDRLTQRLLEAERPIGALLAERLQQVLEPLAPGSAEPLAYRVLVEAAEPVLKLAFRDDPAGDPDVIAELEHLAGTYLAPALDRGPAGGAASTLASRRRERIRPPATQGHP
jgi:AcrR family transcriptional regulator